MYLLINSITGYTYIGVCVDYKRRLRQHNREITGGAKSTKRGAGHWELHRVLCGFDNRSVAMRWEKIVKSRKKGLVSRTLAFEELSAGKCPEPGKQYDVPKEIKLEKL